MTAIDYISRIWIFFFFFGIALTITLKPNLGKISYQIKSSQYKDLIVIVQFSSEAWLNRIWYMLSSVLMFDFWSECKNSLYFFLASSPTLELVYCCGRRVDRQNFFLETLNFRAKEFPWSMQFSTFTFISYFLLLMNYTSKCLLLLLLWVNYCLYCHFV